tara:strand:+ start:213 stop:434 length:222 start_codon:yes stop_codon:yes gene_type:complete
MFFFFSIRQPAILSTPVEVPIMVKSGKNANFIPSTVIRLRKLDSVKNPEHGKKGHDCDANCPNFIEEATDKID